MVGVNGKCRLVLLVLRERRGRAAHAHERVGTGSGDRRQDERRYRHQRYGAENLSHINPLLRADWAGIVLVSREVRRSLRSRTTVDVLVEPAVPRQGVRNLAWIG